VIAVEGGAVLESGGLRISFEGAGSNVTAIVDGEPNAMGALRFVGTFTPIASALVPLIVELGLSIDVIVAGKHVARAGAGVEANQFARLLNLKNVQIGS
jgi:hypothetical protein